MAHISVGLSSGILQAAIKYSRGSSSLPTRAHTHSGAYMFNIDSKY